ncbi:UDP-N-acetylglucosamine acyltransferase [Achromatium sp. WMS3]|nr:UDP-N-acetylglucosamine acyltransferase [Achromatium sp. WMS3]
MLSLVHTQAIIDPNTELAEGVTVGPFAIIGPDVKIGTGTTVGPHAVIRGPTKIGRNNKIYQFASIGEAPQDQKYTGEPTKLEIGDRNVIREFVTINRGTVQDAGITQIGNDNLFMAYTHVAHDCHIGNHVIMANAASLGGHIKVADWAILGGFTIVHQFCCIGTHSFCAMGSVLTKDVLPYITVGGHPAEARGINTEGLRRRAFSKESIQAIRQAYKVLFLSGMRLEEAIASIYKLGEEYPEVNIMADFASSSVRSITR